MTLVLTPAAYLVFVSDNTDIFIRLTLGAALTSRHIFRCNLYHLITPTPPPLPPPHMRCNEDTHSSSWRHRAREASGWDQADERFHQKLINYWVIRVSAACWAGPNLSERHRRRQTSDLYRPALPSQNRFVQVSSRGGEQRRGRGGGGQGAPPLPPGGPLQPPDLQPLSPGSQPPCWCLSSRGAGDLCCLGWRGAAAGQCGARCAGPARDAADISRGLAVAGETWAGAAS